MSDTIAPLVADLVEWIARAPRPYAEVLDAWRTSCPRLPVWEEAVEQGLVAFARTPEGGRDVHVTEAGRQYLKVSGRAI